MEKLDFDILLRTQLGLKAGKMTLKVTDTEIEGKMTILGFMTPVKGFLDSSGHCSLTGEMKTFLNTCEWKGEGTITDDGLSMILKTARNRFVLSGKKRKDDE